MLTETISRIRPLDASAMHDARARIDALAKPPGSLGRLEELAVQMAGVFGAIPQTLGSRTVYVFVADHGIAAEGISAYPAAVTRAMVGTFLSDGAAINVLARHAGATLRIIDVGVVGEIPPHPWLVCAKIAEGTRNFARQSAMTRDEAQRAIEAGIRAFEPCQAAAMGEMGIGNTTAAAAIVAAMTGRPAAEVAGLGTGLDAQGLRRKISAIDRALALHRPQADDPVGVLAAVGGFEIAALVGAMLAAAAARTLVLVDGFISTAAALVAVRLCPGVRPYLVATHQSAERGHAVALEALDLRPLMQLDMRLGEATGAALAFPLVEAACRLAHEMTTLDAVVRGAGKGL